MPDDLIGPRLLTPGGMLVLGGAPKVGKSDFLISLLIHAAAGAPFLRFTASRPLRVFYLQAEIQYHYLRERLQQLRLDPAILAKARDTLVVTPKLRMLLDEQGVGLVAAGIRSAFPDAPPDIICIDPIRNLFDGGPEGEGENDNGAMLFFLQSRVEALRDMVAPEAGVILAHHTKKLSKQQVKDDPLPCLVE
jgi:RecA-family ATPase